MPQRRMDAPKAALAEVGIQFMDDAKAREVIEKLRWPDGVRCVKCGSVDGVYKIKSAVGSTTRPGVFACRDCKGQFTATVGTVMEDSHIPLGKWLVAIHLMAASKKGVSAHQLHRMLGITYKSAWFMAHRVREAMTQEPLAGMLRGTVEADETFVGGIPKNRHANKRAPAPPKTPVLSLVERNGDVRSFKVANVSGKTLQDAIRKHVARDAKIMSDGNASYKGLAKDFAGHEAVDHNAKEYVRGSAHVNTAEAYFAILKRGINGVYHHVSEYHLPRYLAEFDRRWNTRMAKGIGDAERTAIIVKATEGKRLTYRPLVQRAAQ